MVKCQDDIAVLFKIGYTTNMTKPTKQKRRAYPLRITAAVYETLAGIAKKEHRTLNAQIEYVLERWLEQQKAR